MIVLLAFLGCKGSGLNPPATVEDPTSVDGLVGVLITPEDVVVPLGETAQLKLTGLFEDRTTNDLTAVADWISDNPGVADVSGGLDAEGMLTANNPGTANIRAVIDGVESPPVRVEVTEAFLEFLTIEPSAVTVEAGSQVPLRASARFSNGVTSDASGQVRWITGDGTVAQLDGPTLIAAGTGETTVRAEWNGVSSAEVPVSVLNSAEPDVAIAWTNLSVDADGQLSFTAAIENVGNAGATAFWVDAFLNPANPPQVGDVGSVYDEVPFLGPGERTEVAFTFDAPNGFHTVVLLLDSTGELPESNENNNVGDAVATLDAQRGPNLQLTEFTYVSDSTDILYGVVVHNIGSQPSGNFYLDLYVDRSSAPNTGDPGDHFQQVDSLDPDTSTYIDFIIEENCVFCTSWIFADSFGNIDETNESDNVIGPMTVNMNDGSF